MGADVSGAVSLPPGFTLDEQPQAMPQAMPQGFTPDAHAVAGPSDSWLTDTGRRIGTAAIDAVTGLMSPILRSAPAMVGIDTSGHVTRPVQGPLTPQQRDAAYQQARDEAFNQTGVTEYKPETEAGRAGQAALTAGMGGLLTGGGTLPSALGGVVGQELMERTPLSPVAAAVLGQLVGAKAGNIAQTAAPRVLPGGMDPETLALARKAVNDYGITVPLAKASNNPFVRYLDSSVRRMPFSGYGVMDEANQGAFNSGLAKQFGETADKITPEVLNRAYDRIGNVFNTVGSRTNIAVDQQLINDLAGIEQRAIGAGLDTGPLNAVRAQIDKIQNVGAANNGIIPGDVYQNIIAHKGGLSDLTQHGQGIVRDIGGDIRDAIDSALQRSATPEDVAALQQARGQYKALKTIEPLTMRADTLGGATPSTGDVSPAALLLRVNQQYRNAPRAALGDLPLKDLAQIGQRFLKEPGSSGTAERAGIGHMLERGGAVVGGALGAEHFGGLPLHYTVPPLVAALAGPPLLGSMLRNPSFVNRQINGPQFSPLSQVLAAQPMISNGNQP